ncbi:MAG: hypothetical protein R3B07_15105 [Polyangiaceae bacterium]
MTTQLADIVTGIPSLRGVFVTAMPDCLLYDSWCRPEEEWIGEDVASYFGDLVRANREGLKSLGAWSSEMQVTIESGNILLVLRELATDFVVALAFERNAPLGMIRLHVKRLADSLLDYLPKVAPEDRPRGVRVTEFLMRYAPDSHAAMRRVALRTGIPIATLEQPADLSTEQVALLETAVRDILGLEALNI